MNLRATKIEDSFDRVHIKQIQARFSEINMQRRERMRAALTERQQVLLDLLPLLYHVNHPMLPGYVSNDTPCGVSHYTISQTEHNLSKTIARSFKPKKDQPYEDIHGIYIMGSVGTVAQSGSSDLDAWICHRPDLGHQEVQELQVKCKRISEWAASMRLDVHFFLMNADAFRQGSRDSLDKESSGSAQKILLLDEFYRSAIHLAGRTPLWWLVPAAQERLYAEHSHTLLYQRYIREDSVLDFGATANISAGEFIGAGFWQLYKAIGSPYKSVLKLLLLEAYVSEYPDIQPLSLAFKQAIYDGTAKVDQLDSYMMIYNKIERYLQSQGQEERLELARRCFYFKVNKALSLPHRGREKSWQRQLLENLTQSWGWHADYIASLDKRSHWKAAQVSEERHRLVNELNRSYAVLQEFGNAIGVQREIASEELSLLGRKLRAAYELAPGKIEWINPGISENMEEQHIVIRRQDNNWEVVFNGDQHSSLAANRGLVEPLFWCYYNHIVSDNTRLELGAGASLRLTHVKKLLDAFAAWLPRPLPSPSHDNFRSPAVTTKVLILINSTKSGTESLNLQRLGDNANALAYGPESNNLVQEIDLLYYNSWGEVHTRHCLGERAFSHAITEMLNLCLPVARGRLADIQVRCIDNEHEKIIEQRVSQFMAELDQHYYGVRQTPAARMLFKLGTQYSKLQFINAKATITHYANVRALMQGLSEQQTRFSPLLLDNTLLKHHPLHAIAPLSHSHAIRIFFRPLDIGMELFVKDEFGTLYNTLWRGRRGNPLKPLHRFLRAVLVRQSHNTDTEAPFFGVYPIEFYELQKDSTQGFSAARRAISPEIKNLRLFDVKAIAHLDSTGHILYDYYCEDQHFSAASLGEQLEQVVAQYIIGRRNSGVI